MFLVPGALVLSISRAVTRWDMEAAMFSLWRGFIMMAFFAASRQGSLMLVSRHLTFFDSVYGSPCSSRSAKALLSCSKNFSRL